MKITFPTHVIVILPNILKNIQEKILIKNIQNIEYMKTSDFIFLNHLK